MTCVGDTCKCEMLLRKNYGSFKGFVGTAVIVVCRSCVSVCGGWVIAMKVAVFRCRWCFVVVGVCDDSVRESSTRIRPLFVGMDGRVSISFSRGKEVVVATCVGRKQHTTSTVHVGWL